jgi:hypothetical protein
VGVRFGSFLWNGMKVFLRWEAKDLILGKQILSPCICLHSFLVASQFATSHLLSHAKVR